VNRTRATDHTPEAEPVTEHHADRNATLAEADRWIKRHRRHGCQVDWLPHGRIIARHHRLPVAAVLIVELGDDAPPSAVHPSDLAHRQTAGAHAARHDQKEQNA